MFRTILVPLDESALAEQAIRPAADLARAAGGALELVLAHHAETSVEDGESDTTLPDQRIYLRSCAEEIAAASRIRVDHAVETGSPAESICRRAHDVGADLIVMTSHGRTGLRRSWLGSVADAVVRHSSVPVLMLRAVDASTRQAVPELAIRRLLVALDGSESSMSILDSAVSLARYRDATIVLARVVAPSPLYIFDGALPGYPVALEDPETTKELADIARTGLEEIAAYIERNGSIRVETQVVVSAHTGAALLDLARAQSADAVAMTTRGRGTSRLLLGSVTDSVLRGSDLPLLLYHPLPLAASVEVKTPVATFMKPAVAY